MRKYFPLADSFLEIGCATGLNISHFREAFPELKISGFELFTEGLSFMRNRVSDAFIFQAEARRIPFDKEFDVIGAFDVLEHIEQDTVVLGQMYQATRPGGGILVSVPQHPLLWSQRDEHLLHKRRYTRKEMLQKVRGVGFKIVRSTSFVSLLFPGMIWDSLKNRRPNRDYNPLAKLQVGRATNATFTLLLSLERHLIKLGLSLPVGGSLFLVAKRI
jgi:SAM-dependent methyltransferase